MSYNNFTGFTLDGVHSSELGVLRVMKGSRYSIDLLPQLKRKTAEVPGGDGDYYYGATISSGKLTIDLAFMELTRGGLKRLRQVMHTRLPYTLTFDEEPFKVYTVIPDSFANFEYIPFEDANGQIYYNGEISMSFYLPYPYARTPSNQKYLINYNETNPEWNSYAELLSAPGEYDDITKNSFYIYNPGEESTDWELWFLFGAPKEDKFRYIELSALTIGANFGIMGFSPMKQKGADVGVRISARTHLLEGFEGSLANPVFTGNLYNEHFISGSFFRIPIVGKKKMSLTITGQKAAKIDYDYLWL